MYMSSLKEKTYGRFNLRQEKSFGATEVIVNAVESVGMMTGETKTT